MNKIDLDKLKAAVEKWGGTVVEEFDGGFKFAIPAHASVNLVVRERNNTLISECVLSFILRHMIEFNADGSRSDWHLSYQTNAGWEAYVLVFVPNDDAYVDLTKQLAQIKDESEPGFLSRALIRRMGIE